MKKISFKSILTVILLVITLSVSYAYKIPGGNTGGEICNGPIWCAKHYTDKVAYNGDKWCCCKNIDNEQGKVAL